jgi:hypothetical protein
MQLGKLFFQQDAPFRRDVDQELLRFPAGKHDDIVDAYAWCMRLVLAHRPPSKPKPAPLKSWKTKLAAYGLGETTHMAA